MLEYSPAGANAWAEICRRSGSGSCNWATGGLANGAYDLRATATDALGNSASPIVLSNRLVDNSPPTTTVAAQPAPIESGDLTMRIDVSDAGGSNVQRVVFQGRAAGSGPWMDVCVDTAAPYECSGNTAGFDVPGYGYVQVPDGMYEMRATAYDGAGNAVDTPTFTFRIDNTKPSISGFNPPQLTGTVPLAASVSDAGSGLDTVRIEGSDDNGSSWITLCSSASCDWNVPAGDATWDLRAVATDLAGNQQTANAADRPGGTRPVAQGVSGVNGGVLDTLDAGDTLTFTYSEAIAPASIVAGWDGSGSRPVTVMVANGASDTITIGQAALGQSARPRRDRRRARRSTARVTHAGARDVHRDADLAQLRRGHEPATGDPR